jgi:hypothetical protein
LKNKGYKVCLKNWNDKNIWVQSQFLYDTKNIFLDYKDLRMSKNRKKLTLTIISFGKISSFGKIFGRHKIYDRVT